uniref:Nucleolar and spindle associated protein 1 n=1 Tax=Macaca fascicularis TaxID=9541 RepID=A0A2K5WZ45_MACFA
MIIASLEELDSLKYSDLQNLAKSLGLRANLRADKLLKALKGHVKHEARKENENQDESQTSASSCDETEIQISNQEQAEREPTGHVTKTRRRRRTVRVDPDSQQNHSEIKISNPTEFQNHEKQEYQDLRATANVPSPPDEHQGAENAVSSGNKDSKVPSKRKKSVYTDESSKPGKNKRTAITTPTPNFKKLHEAHFKEMESIDQYIERKKKHFEERNSMNDLKQHPINKGGVRTPVPPRGRLSVASTPIGQRHSQGRSCGPASQSTLGLKRSLKRSAISAAKTSVRFSAATKDNEHKRSLTKTPARKSAHVTMSGDTPKVITPFKLTTEATQTPVSNKKPVFETLCLCPKLGKLKPWGQSKENNYLNQHVNRINFYKKTYKQPHLQTKEEQRKKREQERKEKKAKVLGMRRGLILAED